MPISGRDDYLGIIPARAGSKRLPDKNARLLSGEPLLTWTIRAAKACNRLSCIFVSTDSPVLQRLAVENGVTCPELRPANLATDEASSVAVVRHVIEKCEAEALASFDHIVLLQPTSPLRTAYDIDMAIDLYEEKTAKSVVSVCKAECPPNWINVVGDDLRMDDFMNPRDVGIRSQDLGSYYRLNGAIYIISKEEFLYSQSFYTDNSFAYVMPRNRSVDVDSIDDMVLAEFHLRNNIVE